MKLAALFSGGKDSTYSIYRAMRAGHKVCCVLTIYPESADSHLLHHPGIKHTKTQALSMKMPHHSTTSPVKKQAEDDALNRLVRLAIKNYDIDGIIHGGIRSAYQKDRFSHIAKLNNLTPVSPVWKSGSAASYMYEMVREGFKFIVQSVSSGGLDEYWLGRLITTHDIKKLENLGESHGFSVDFEGGEAETFVVDCPLFSRPITLCGTTHWDGYIGRFEILEATLSQYAR